MNHKTSKFAKMLVLSGLALIAFAVNSIICRLALGKSLIDPASFSTIRIFSGALVLLPFAFRPSPLQLRVARTWRSAVALFAYMTLFSFAYLSIGAGTGALILFGATQILMFLVAFRTGERCSPLSWTGFVVAIFGLIYLALPNMTSPGAFGALLMAGAGIAWGIYTLSGRSAIDPVRHTARNFLYAFPMALVVSLIFAPHVKISGQGVALAVTSGAITSGIGYVIWYAALCHLTVTRAATIQLLVPALAASGGIVLLDEPVTFRFVLAAAMILCGVYIAIHPQAKG